MNKVEIKIKRWDTNEVIICGEYESIRSCLEKNRVKSFYRADLRGADLRGAYLRGAYLQEADLRGADLRGAYLQEADLRGADLRGAYLRGAYLQEPLFLPDLYSLKLFSPNTKLRFWKYLRNGKTPYQNSKYKVGKTYKEKDYSSDENILCGKGLNVATLVWCLKDNSDADEFLEVEFAVKDIVAIPFITDGKFRVKRYKVIQKYNRKQVVKLLKGAIK